MTISATLLRPDPELATLVVEQLDRPGWRTELERDGVRVCSSRTLPAPVVGYRTQTEHDASAESLVAFLGAGLFGAFERLNARYAFGEVLNETPLVVRTGFTMPPGLQHREFVHSLSVTPMQEGVWVVGYDAVEEGALPQARPGFLRCPMYPSGQRIRALGPTRCRVEHLMVYELGGGVPTWAQNRLFHRGHVKAYRDEWSALIAHSRRHLSAA